MEKVKFRLAMMCDLGPEHDSKLVSEMWLPDDEAKELKPFENESGEVVIMGSYCPLGLIYNRGKGSVAVGKR